MVVEVGAVAQFDGRASTGDQALWDFGDGEQATGFQVEHRYDKPGNYTAVLQVTGSDGSKKTDGLRVIAHQPLSETPPVWASTVVLHPENGHAYVVNPEHDSVAVISPEGALVEEISTCESPRTLSVDASLDRLLVACDKASAVDVFDASSFVHQATISFGVGERPFGVLSRDGQWWVGLQSADALARFDEVDEVERIEGFPDPRGIAMAPDGTLFASRWRSVDEQGWVGQENGQGIALSLDTDPDSDTTSGGVPTLLDSLSISPDGGTLYVPGHQANVRRGLFQNGKPLTFETSVRAVLRVIQDGAEVPSLAKLFDERGHASVAVPSRWGNLVFVLHPGSQTISILDAYSGASAGSILNVGHTPSGLALSADGDRLYVNAWMDRRLNVYDIRDLSSHPEVLHSVSTVEQEVLDADVLEGKRVFYSSADTRMTRSGYLSCGHCHPDGREDGIVWDFTDRGEGLRNTTTLEGLGGLNEGPLHWTGNFDELQDFEADMRNAFGGSGFLSESDWEATSDSLGNPKAGLSPELDALAAFILSLEQSPASPYMAPDGGEDAFAAAGCEDCHPPPTYTDSSTENPVRHDVGTFTAGSGQRMGDVLDGLDTPSLLGVQATGPYLHNGSALSLEEAVSAHNSATALDQQTVELLADFLRSL